ncbi:hypothetical protein [Azotobacter vinelandii]|uniref:hypothetical protein n=1 Tax=Azotobacter vinelandii TaxID=354 RepID=UPI000911EFE0|nr:hypothetical protein [Azotobacter vinelandii]WKN20567.1 hypothetical protein AVAEIV_003567 [Azotobacter vinelandii]WKN23154.1 hypothetical protein AVAEIV_001189 [Azotobacter vinelandii]SFY22705.1 hypothetical protein SAMN04244547_04581 [Azotobacter vinelandii]
MGASGFEYRTEYIAIPFKTHTTRGLIFKSEEPTLAPDIDALLQGEADQLMLKELGQSGWELVSVQAVCRAELQVGNQNAQGWAYGFAMPVGYLLFFKRARPA